MDTTDLFAEAHEIAKGRFRSKKQWRWAYATGQPFARRWAHNTPGGPGTRYRQLPTRVKKAEEFLAALK